MPPDAALKAYLAAVEQAYRAGNATEHTYRPACKTLIEALAGAGVTAVNEPRQIDCGAPDFIIVRGTVPLGYIEAKDVGIGLAKVERSEQLLRYRGSLGNLVLTDYLEFRWYLDGELRLTASLPRPGGNGRIRWNESAASEVAQLLTQFLAADLPLKSTPHDLATRMARLAQLIRGLIENSFSTEGDRGELHAQFEAFRKVLIKSLSVKQFADMYAQTLCYGLFAARCNAPSAGFTRQSAAAQLPKTNPFLRKLFHSIAGPDLDPRVSWAVDQLAELLARADMAAILADFGHRTRREDPVVHFYETFLAAYDPKMREARGVYYTPEPVVGYIVRSVDALLQREFGLKEGLAHAGKVRWKSLKHDTTHGKRKSSTQITEVEAWTHRVQILDPATGTGTFLYAVIQKIRERFEGNAGAWPGYVAEHLLPRLFGFELLMAPYAVAHMKLGLELERSGYDFSSDERLGVFLTNSLEEAHEKTGLPLFSQWLADESQAASRIKRDVPVMVVLGNPPYSGHSSNKGEWIEDLMGEYKQSAELQKPAQAKWLSDDYVKFIRFAQWRIEQTGYGILAFVTNHGYLDNPTFMDMRFSLMRSFDEIYVCDLHGNSKKKEHAPDGGKDENVFDIQQGVAIGIFVRHVQDPVRPEPVQGRAEQGAAAVEPRSRRVAPAKIEPLSRRERGRGEGTNTRTASSLGQAEPSPAPSGHPLPAGEGKRLARVFHADLYGTRAVKYAALDAQSVAVTQWTELTPASPSFLFVQQDADRLAEYEHGWSLRDVFAPNGDPAPGIVTTHDEFAISWTPEEAARKVERLLATTTESEARGLFKLCSQDQWRYARAKRELADGKWREKVVPILYRPFDVRWTVWDSNVAVHRRTRAFDNFVGLANVGLAMMRQASIDRGYSHILAVGNVADNRAMYSNRGIMAVSPLWLYPHEVKRHGDNGPTRRVANLAPAFVAALTQATGAASSPEDTLAYIYAVLYAPSYRTRYADFLKRDFPRVPLTTERKLFAALVAAGRELIALHTMQTRLPRVTGFPVAGSNEVVKVRYAASAPPSIGRGSPQRGGGMLTSDLKSHLLQSPFVPKGEVDAGRVWINARQYFEGVPQAVWDMHIGGYRVAEKWLKDRKGRTLSYDDLSHYQNITAALARTLVLQAGIDAAIEAAGGWPLA
ncbi:MAG: DNA methyltransferase [Rhodanobacteraceae bacterium]|nr:MAG: DNA methyltransferase [Rhodanobacteraceae bacterium]